MAKRCIKLGVGRSIFQNRSRLVRGSLRGQPATMSLKPPAGKNQAQELELEVPEMTVIPEKK
jgi:hypothetical protein